MLIPTFIPIHSWTMPSSTLALELLGPSVQLGSGRMEELASGPTGLVPTWS